MNRVTVERPLWTGSGRPTAVTTREVPRLWP
jgi:hypothetical protein